MTGLVKWLIDRWNRLHPPAPDPRPVPDPNPPPTPPTPPPAPQPAPRPPPAPVDEVVPAINRARASQGLAALNRDRRLDISAAGWAQAMADEGTLTHGNFGARLWSVIPNSTGGEDIGEGYPDADMVVAAWMGSPPHRANILGDFTLIGVGEAIDTRNRCWWCADFDRP